MQILFEKDETMGGYDKTPVFLGVQVEIRVLDPLFQIVWQKEAAIFGGV